MVPGALKSEAPQPRHPHRVGLFRPCQATWYSYYAAHHAFSTLGRQVLSVDVYLSLDIHFSQELSTVLIIFFLFFKNKESGD